MNTFTVSYTTKMSSGYNSKTQYGTFKANSIEDAENIFKEYADNKYGDNYIIKNIEKVEI